jgi:hypothetical protein
MTPSQELDYALEQQRNGADGAYYLATHCTNKELHQLRRENHLNPERFDLADEALDLATSVLWMRLRARRSA